ncbi:hypothetical protein F0U59_21805 [Archangium gephyra]|nr:hypothetical protein F0U59_21805 [Archangium gephyra]
MLQEIFPRGWTVVLPDLNSLAEAHARENLARRIEPLVDVELKRLEELARVLHNDPGAEQGQEEAVHRLIKAVRGWKVVLDAAGFLAINSFVLRNR